MAVEYYVTKNALEVVRRFKARWPNIDPPTDKTVKATFDKLKATGSVLDDLKGNVGRHVETLTPQNIKNVQSFFSNTRNPSIRKCMEQLRLSYGTVWRILHHELKWKAYKISVHHLLRDIDIERRLNFAQEMLQKIGSKTIDVKKIWFSDECHFYLHGYVNKQNHRVWGSENPHFTMERPLHPEYLTVWCAISATKIIGPYFFYSTVNGENYLTMLNEFFFPAVFKAGMVTDFWFQQDGAPPHRTSDVKQSIRWTFEDRVIGLGFETDDGSEIAWPPYSPDLNPPDYYLWGATKDHVYQQAPRNLGELKKTIENYIRNIPAATLDDVVRNFEERLRLLVRTEGHHFENIIG